MRPPQRNLGPGNDWGRWVEEQLQGLSTSATQAEQGNQRSFANNNAALKQLTNQLNDIRLVVESLPVSDGYHDFKQNWVVPSNATTKISDILVSWPDNKTKAIVLVIASGWYDSYAASAIPMAYRASFDIAIGTSTSPAVPLIAQNMDTYAFVGSYSSVVTSGETFSVSFRATNPSTYVASSTALNRLNFDVITIFS